MKNKKETSREMLLSFLMAFCSTIAIKYSEHYFCNISNSVENSSFTWTIVFLLFLGAYNRYYPPKIRFNNVTGVLAICFSLIMCIGNCIKLLGEFSLNSTGGLQISFLFIQFWGFIIIFYFIFYYIFQFANGSVCELIDIKNKNITSEESIVNKLLAQYDKHVFLYSFLVMYICWLPFIIFSYPGSMSYDAGEQLYRFTGNAPINNHHPILSTYLIGICFRLGKALYSDNLGIFIYMIFQSSIFAAALAYMLKYIKKLGLIQKWRIIILLFFSLFSLWPMYAQWVVKDTLYCSFVVFYVVNCIRLVAIKDYKSTNFMLVKVFIIASLVCFLRNNGIYVVILSLPFLAVLEKIKKNRFKLYYTTVSILIMYILFNNCLLGYLNIEGSSIKEMLSIPFQQTANYIRTYPDEVTEREKTVIDTILDYDAIKENYNPFLADFVKETYRGKNMSSEQLNKALKDYFNVWIQQFLKHPLNYINTTFSNTYCYYYPENKHVAWTSHVHIGNEFMDQYPDFSEIHQIDEFSRERQILNSVYYTMNNMPIVGMFDYTGTHTWFYLICIILLIKNRRSKHIVPLLPAIITILIALVSPVNGTTRYMLPAMAVSPILITYTMKILVNKNIEESSAQSSNDGCETKHYSSTSR